MCDICKAISDGMSTDEAVDAYLSALQDTIELHGWAMTGPVDGDPPMTHTVGRTLQGLPELLIDGLDIGRMAGILTNVQKRYADIGPGQLLTDVVNRPYILGVIEADPIAADMVVALRLFPDHEVRALQLVWPDAKNRLPWEDGYVSEWPQPLYPVQQD